MKKTATIFLTITLIIFSVTIISAQNSEKKEYVITTPPKSLNLDPFYKKYANVNGIHIMSSHRVPDSAFVKALLILCKRIINF